MVTLASCRPVTLRISCGEPAGGRMLQTPVRASSNYLFFHSTWSFSAESSQWELLDPIHSLPRSPTICLRYIHIVSIARSLPPSSLLNLHRLSETCAPQSMLQSWAAPAPEHLTQWDRHARIRVGLWLALDHFRWVWRISSAAFHSFWLVYFFIFCLLRARGCSYGRSTCLSVGVRLIVWPTAGFSRLFRVTNAALLLVLPKPDRWT